MFNIELNDDGVDMLHKLFGITPVLVFSKWTNYTGTCVWRVNQYSTYSVPGEPTDSRWGGFWDDGVFADVITKDEWTSPTRKLWKLYRERFPEEAQQATAATDRQVEYDRETMFVHGAALTGGIAKKDENGDWTIEERPRKKILGIF